MTEFAERPADQLVALLYDELRALARAHLRRERVGHTLGTTALVNEAYLRLAGQTALSPAGRTRFFAMTWRGSHPGSRRVPPPPLAPPSGSVALWRR